MSDEKKLTIAVLIIAGGSGTRMDCNIPKQYLNIRGFPILSHTLKIFEDIENISHIHCVIGAGHEELYKQAVKNNYPHTFSIGGETRQESVHNGLKALTNINPDIVLIHDAARPCVRKDDILRLIQRLEYTNAATLAHAVTESLQRNGESVDRDNLWIIQTPQGFKFQNILAAHKNAENIFTDDTSVYMAHFQKPIEYVACGRHNLKITTPEDLDMAENLLSLKKTENVAGLGFDVHAFEIAQADSIRLCGIDIPHDRPLEGHSDADIGLHVLTDAILSSISENDIGYHFPSSDKKYKNMDSHVFLDKALELLNAAGGEIRHVDITFICEKPNIGKHREQMRSHLSDYLGIPVKRISIKGTTTQKLGFTGRGEGIACQAVVTTRIFTDD